MRYLSRIPTVLPRTSPPCLYNPRLPFRLLSSFEAANASEHLRPPATGHVPRFDWRLRVPSPKPSLSTVQKALEKRAQPPLPTYSHPYNAHIRKYKDQSVTYRVLAQPIHCSPPPPPPASSPFYHPSVRRTRPSLESASRTGAWVASSKRAIVSLTPRHTGWISQKPGDRLLVLCLALVLFSLPTSLSEILFILRSAFLRLNRCPERVLPSSSLGPTLSRTSLTRAMS